MTKRDLFSNHLTILTIERMSIDLLEFWLDKYWNEITQGLNAEMTSTDKTLGPYIYVRHIAWSSDSFMFDPEVSFPYNRMTRILWAQTWTDRIQMQVGDEIGREGGEMSTRLIHWLSSRFNVIETPGIPSTISLPEEEALTPTETKVADMLADGFSYPQIAKEMGRSGHAALKHGQNIARKWRTKQTAEILAVEAKRRGFGRIDSI